MHSIVPDIAMLAIVAAGFFCGYSVRDWMSKKRREQSKRSFFRQI